MSRSVGDEVAAMQAPLPEIQVPAEELGAGADDFQKAHRTRCGRLLGWIQRRSFYFGLPIAEMVEGILDRLQYCFFGHSGEVASVAEVCSRTRSPIALAESTLLQALQVWSPDPDGAWRILALSGWSDFGDQEAMQCARSSILITAGGLFFRFELKLTTFPWVLQQLANEDCTGPDKDALCRELLAAKACDLPLFANAFRNRFPTLAALRSSEAAAVASLWARGKQFSTKRSELGHAQERQALAAAAAPGRSFVHHVHRDPLRKARALHVESGGDDPQREGALRQARRSTPEVGPAQLEGMAAADQMLPPAESAKIEALCAWTSPLLWRSCSLEARFPWPTSAQKRSRTTGRPRKDRRESTTISGQSCTPAPGVQCT